jgi:murein L,D-transpeptidase YcbB/YkuD
LYEDGEPIDSMKAVVGKISSQTPMLAAAIGGVELNPYWNVPPDLVPRLIASRVLEDGPGYLRKAGYEVLSDWGPDAQPIAPDAIDWQAVSRGKELLRVRQLPGPTNSMGGIKFLMNNPYGIFLHDTPNRELFAERDRWMSNGCVRVEDAPRLARWLFGTTPQGRSGDAGEVVGLDQPMPVFITYLTAAPAGDGVAFRTDPYGRDGQAMAALFGSEREIQTASRF